MACITDTGSQGNRFTNTFSPMEKGIMISAAAVFILSVAACSLMLSKGQEFGLSRSETGGIFTAALLTSIITVGIFGGVAFQKSSERSRDENPKIYAAAYPNPRETLKKIKNTNLTPEIRTKIH